MVLVNLQPLHPDAKYQPLFRVSSKMGDGSDIQGLFDQILTKIQMQIPVPVILFDGDPSSNFRHDLFSSSGLTGIETVAEISTSYPIRWMRRM
jgi:5'-3' exonuclease